MCRAGGWVQVSQHMCQNLHSRLEPHLRGADLRPTLVMIRKYQISVQHPFNSTGEMSSVGQSAVSGRARASHIQVFDRYTCGEQVADRRIDARPRSGIERHKHLSLSARVLYTHFEARMPPETLCRKAAARSAATPSLRDCPLACRRQQPRLAACETTDDQSLRNARRANPPASMRADSARPPFSSRLRHREAPHPQSQQRPPLVPLFAALRETSQVHAANGQVRRDPRTSADRPLPTRPNQYGAQRR